MSKNLSWEEVGVVEIPLQGKYGAGKVALVDGDYDGEYLSGFTWYMTPNGYIYRSSYVNLDGDSRRMIYLHQEVCRPLKGHWVDHINRNKLDNRSINLRSVTPKVNNNNRRQGRRKRLLGRYRGVIQVNENCYQARCRNGNSEYYPTDIEAAKAYDAMAFNLYGVDAVLNFPNY